MNSFTKHKVVKSYAVEVSGPCLVDCQFEEFEVLTEHLTVLASTAGLDEELVEGRRDHGAWIVDQAADTLQRAEQEAGAILSKARQEAEQMIEQMLREAEAEIAQRREALETSVRAEVLPNAREEGFQAGLAQGEAIIRARQQETERLIRLAEAAVRAEYARVDEELLHLAVRMAERIVRGTLGVQPQRLLDIARSLAVMPQEREHMMLHVAPEDGAWLSSLESEMLPCPWVADDSLASGECFLECEEGIFTARLEDQLEKLEKSLREELKYGGVESTNPQS